MKKRISVIMALVLMLSTIFSVNVFAKVNLPTISKNNPITTYTYNSSGKVYAYKASNLKTKTGGYIACSTDECKIIEISGNAVKVTYPVSNGTKTAWFSRDEFTKRDLANDVAKSSFPAQAKVTTYKWKGKTSTLGSVAKNDKCYLLKGDENSDWVQIIYPVSKGYKMGWITGSDYAKLRGIKIEPTSTPSSKKSEGLISPLKGSLKNTPSSSSTNGVKCDFSAAKGTPVYAPADGTVQYIQVYGKTTKNGDYKLISYGNQIMFTSADGKYTVLMGHLNSFNGISLKIPSSQTAKVSTWSGSKYYNKTAENTRVRKVLATNDKIKQGDLLGYTGETGNAHGPHLHMEVKQNGSAVNPISVMKSWK